jgi:Flp pilus assembly pilin Flp
MAAWARERLMECLGDEEGAGLVEYILLAVLIGVAAITGMTFFGNTTGNKTNNISIGLG